MIFVTLGTQDKPFTRLLDAIEKCIDHGEIKEEVIVQAGQTKYESKKMKIFELLSQEDFSNYIDKCDILITHGGVGAILNGLEHGKKIIACARLKKYGEHTNDHQLQIIKNFAEKKYVLELEKFDDLGKILKQIKDFKVKKYESNTEKFCKNLKAEIDKL